LAENALGANGNKSTHVFMHSLEDKAMSEHSALKTKNVPNVGFRRLFGMQTPDMKFICVGLFGASLRGAVMPLFAFIISTKLSVFGEPDTTLMREKAMFCAAMFVLLAVGGFCSNVMQHAGFGIAGKRLTMRIRELSFFGIYNVPL
jgi:hypothetical protein